MESLVTAIAAALAILALDFILPPITFGTGLGLFFGAMVGFPVAWLAYRSVSGPTPFLLLLATTYWGGRAGSRWNNLGWPTASVPSTPFRGDAVRILDTSVIIDGRIAEVAETGFLDGVFAIPRFVLAELQQVADSADPLKRTRGRRGLDVLQRIQASQRISVEILDDDFPQIREVDQKLVALAKARKAALVTNDFNLNKVASLEGVTVLNVNELAGALRPVVLPGEQMRILVSREGKEAGQGVAYLDDGTMVVIENGRRMINKTVDVVVTSVLQTAAGKMIFARYDDRAQSHWEREAQARVSAS